MSADLSSLPTDDSAPVERLDFDALAGTDELEAGKPDYLRVDLDVHERREQAVADGGLEPPSGDDALTDSYTALREAAGDAILRVDEAKSSIAGRTTVPKNNVSRRVLKPRTVATCGVAATRLRL